MKILNQLLLGALACAAATPVMLMATNKANQQAGTSQPRMEAPSARLFKNAVKADASDVKNVLSTGAEKTRANIPGSAVMWGNVAYSASWPAGDRSNRGIYSFMTSAPVGYPLLTDEDMQFCYGSGVVDGVFYGMTMDAERNATLFTIDINTWNVTGIQPVTDLSLVALATAEDYDNQVVYGQFYNKDFNGYELGIIDYSQLTRTTIGPLANTYVALGFYDGILYGIATDGYLYAINASTGIENKRGVTGLELVNQNGNYYMQGGEVSKVDNTFYWAAIDKDGYSGMYTVDLSSGHATLCGAYTGIIYALTSPVEAPVQENAPAVVEDYWVEMTGINTASINFTLPVTTYGGAVLSGELAYEVQCNGATVINGVGEAGAQKEIELEIMSEGTTIVSVFARNDAGKGVAANATVWAGYDYPLPARNVNVNSTDNQLMLSWSAPAGGANDGYVGAFTYDIYRYVNGEKTLVAQNLTDTSYYEAIPTESLSVISYGVVADNNGKKGLESASNSLVLGEAVIPDYLEDFRTAENFRLWTLYDANNDDHTWQYDAAHHCIYYQNGFQNADDWLISPAVTMDARRTYKVVVRANNTSNLPERLEVKMGKNPTVSAMNKTIFDEIKLMQLNQLDGMYFAYVNDNVKVTQDGSYYLGLHAISDGGMNKLRVDSVYVEAGPVANAPAQVGDLSIISASDGTLSATIAFRAPVSNIDGTSIAGNLDKIEIKRGNKVIKTFSNVVPGTELEFIDNEPISGYNTYRIIPWAANEFGQYAESNIWVGFDMPAPLAAVTATPEGDKVKLHWEAASAVGAHGGVVDVDNVTYDIFDASMAYGFAVPGEKIGSADTNEFVVNLGALSGPQSMRYWMVAPVNPIGECEKTLASLLVGAPYMLPFDEHFSNGAYEKFWRLLYPRNVNVAVYVAQGVDSDGDGYALQCDNYATNDEQQAVISGKIDLAEAANPTLLFDIKGNDRITGVSVLAIDMDGNQTPLGDIEVADAWNTVRVSLASLDTTSPVQVAILMKFAPMDDQTWEYGSAWIDNIKVIDLLKHNLVAELEAPAQVLAGFADEPAELKITVKNTGELAADSFMVRLLEDGTEIWSREGSKLAALSDQTFAVDYAPSSDYESKDVTLTAVVEFADDEFAGDNEAEKTIIVKASEVAAPENLSVDEKSGLLSWTAPDTTPEVILEDFESYTPWATYNIGDWKLYDGDKGTVQGLFPSMTNPVEGTAYAFTIFAPRDYTGDGSGIDMTSTYPRLAPHSGDYYLTASRAIEGWNSVQQDNWIISPLLPCVEQEISFWVNNNMIDGYPYIETFSIWASEKGRDVANFVQISDDIQASTGEWTEVKVKIPADYRYFAIRQTSGPWDTYFFMIDDITYALGGGEIKGYLIYLDGEKIGEADGTDTTFQLTETDGSHEVAISALYANGLESKRVRLSYEPDGIAPVFTDGQPVDIYSIEGSLVRRGATSPESLDAGIYIAGGRKIIVK